MTFYSKSFLGYLKLGLFITENVDNKSIYTKNVKGICIESTYFIKYP